MKNLIALLIMLLPFNALAEERPRGMRHFQTESQYIGPNGRVIHQHIEGTAPRYRNPQKMGDHGISARIPRGFNGTITTTIISPGGSTGSPHIRRYYPTR